MTRMGLDEVRLLASLARLRLTDEEIVRMAADLDRILGLVETLRAVDTTGVEPMTHAVPFDCPLRADQVQPPLPVEEALRNAPRREDGYFQVPSIVAAGGADRDET